MDSFQKRNLNLLCSVGEIADQPASLPTQERIPILFFTPEMTRSLAVRNSLAPFFADALRRVQAMPEWSMKDFNAAREVVYAKYPTVTKLWNALQRVK